MYLFVDHIEAEIFEEQVSQSLIEYLVKIDFSSLL